MEQSLHLLKSLGLSDKEARSYLALLELGPATAYQVAQKSKLKRSITYVVLDELRLKGLVLKVPHIKKQLFIAKSPDELFADQEEKLRYAKRALPELLALSSSKNKKMRLISFEGKEGVRDALRYNMAQLAHTELLALYGKGKSKAPVAKSYREHNELLHNQGTTLRGFAPHHISLEEFRALDMKFGWNIKQLKESKFSSEVSVEIANTFVRILLYKDDQAVIIENVEFAKMMREVFEMLWKHEEKN